MTTTVTLDEQIHAIQDQIANLKFRYSDDTLEFRALHLAEQAARLAWYAVKHNNDGGHLVDLEQALRWYEHTLSIKNEF